jgi:hypothetical protein
MIEERDKALLLMKSALWRVTLLVADRFRILVLTDPVTVFGRPADQI